MIALWHSVTKRGSTYERCFWHSLYLFFVLGGDFIFVWLELVELFRLYLGASLCSLSFSSCHIVFCVGLYMLGGVYFVVLVSNFLLIYDYEFFIIICLYCVLFEVKIFIFLYLYFLHTCGYAFCLSVSGNIQVDSIKLLSTLATDG